MGDNLTSKEIGERLRHFRKAGGLTQEQLAERTGVSYQQIQLYESGKSRLNTDKLQSLAKALSLPVAVFFDEVVAPLTLEEKKLLNAYRAVASPEVRQFILHCLAK